MTPTALFSLLLLLSLGLGQPLAAAKPNRVLQLDGHGDFVQLPSDIFNHLEAATVEAWVRWDGFGYAPHWFSYGSRGSNRPGPAQIMGIDYWPRSAKLVFYLYTREARPASAKAHLVFFGGQWLHMAAVSGPDGMRLYINGHLVGAHAYGGSFAALLNGAEVYLGRSSWSGNSDFQGQLDEVRVWNAARSVEQIRQTMHQRLTGAEPDLEALWNFDGGDADDLGPGRHHGRLYGDAACPPAPWPGTGENAAMRVLEGQVADARGNPVPKAQIHLIQRGVTRSIQPTAADGMYRLYLYGAESFDAVARTADHSQWHADLSLAPGQRQRLDFALQPSNRLTGRVLALDDAPLPGVLIEAWRQDGDRSHLLASDHTDARGRYRLDDLKPGTYLLRCHADRPHDYPETLAVGPQTRRQDLDFRLPPFKKGRWTRYGVFAGLGTDNVQQLVHSRDGRLYLGTDQDGVWVFDGQRFAPLGTEQGLADAHVEHLYEDRDGILWIATEQGLWRYDGDRFLPLPHPELAEARVNRIAEGRDGALWFAVRKEGLWRLDGDRLDRIALDDSPVQAGVRVLYPDRDDILWIATERGVTRYDGKRFLPFDGAGLINHRVYDIHQDTDGIFWFATRRGVTRYDGVTFSHLADHIVRPKITYDLFSAADGALWLAQGDRAVRFDGTEYTVFSAADGLDHAPVRQISQTPDGLLWFAAGTALLAYDAAGATTFSAADGLAGSDIRALHAAATGDLWVGTERGLSRLDGRGRSAALAPALQRLSGPFEAIHSTPDGALWLANADGLWQYDGSDLHRRLAAPGTYTFDLYTDRQGVLWAATDQGALQWRDGDFALVEVKGRKPFVRIGEDPDGVLWFVTREGNARSLDGRQAVKPQQAARNRKILSAYGTPDSSLWLGTGRGLLRLDGPQLDRITQLTTTQNILVNHIRTILHQDDRLYFGSDSGLLVHDRTAWSHLDVDDGLPSNIVQALAGGGDGSLWIGTPAGLLRYRPSTASPGVRFTAVQVDTLTLPPWASGPIKAGTRITVQAQAVDYRTQTAKRQYRFRIDDSPWGPVSASNRFDYQPESAGTHRIQVQAIDRDLNYSPPARLDLTVVWPWYRNAWITGPLAAALGLMVAALAFLGQRTVRQRRETERLRQEVLQQEQQARSALERTNAELEEANRAKSAFLANMSHEIRTPLNIMLGYAQIMGRNADITEQSRQQLKTIQDSGTHLLGLINEVLDLSKIEAGRLERQDIDFDLVALIDSLQSMLGLSCREKGLAFAVAWHRDQAAVEPPQALGLRGDEGKLRQILINLLSNAVKFTQQGEVALDIALPGAAGPPDLYGFEVRDTGQGIPPALQAEIFEPFAQGENSRKTPGTGLGLAIARHYVELLGGQLTLDSQPEQGTRLSFVLPMPSATAPADADAPQGQVAQLAPGSAVAALVVDDVEANRLVLCSLLESIGASVHNLASGEDALDYLADHRPDIVFIDMWMPGLNGLETAQQAGTLGQADGPRWVVVSASTLEHEQQRCLEAGFDAFIGKPVDQTQLYETLARLLQVEFEYTRADAFDPTQASLPAALWQSLHTATRTNDLTALEDALDEVAASGPQGPALAQALSEQIDRIDMDAIVALLEKVNHD